MNSLRLIGVSLFLKEIPVPFTKQKLKYIIHKIYLDSN